MDLVVGATGVLGGRIAQKLAGRGDPVRALVRRESPGRAEGPHTSVEQLDAWGVDIYFGDLADRDSLDRALSGARRVVSTANSAKRRAPDTVEAVDRDGNLRLIEAAQDAGVGQFVFVSASGADPASPVPLLAAKGATEALLARSRLPYTVLRPEPFMEDWISGLIGSQLLHGPRVTLVGAGDRRHGFVAVDNVADLAVAVLGRPEALRATLEFAGDCACFRDVVHLYEEEMHRKIEVRSVLPGDRVPGLSPELSALWAGIEAGPEFDRVSTDTASTYGVRLIGLSEFVQGRTARA